MSQTKVEAGGIDSNAVTSANISDNSITTDKIANSNITPSKLSTGSPSWDTGGTLSVVGNIIINNGSPTVFFQDTDSNSAMLHCNSNLLYVLRGGTNSTTWTQVNGQWPLYINLTNNDAVFGGNISAVGDITAFVSDIRLKANIEPISNALDKVLSLNGFTYNFNEIGKELGFDVDIRHSGVSAQDIQKVLPESVAPAPANEDYLTVKYEKLVPLLIEAIKEQQSQINTLKSKIEKLEKK